MKPIIEAIFFDIGGTLRTLDPIEGRDVKLILQMMQLIGATGDPNEFANGIIERHKSYRAWCQKTLIELNEKELWTKFMLSGFPPELIRRNALQLNYLWRESAGKRVNYPGAFETIRALAKRGYILGVISNTDSSTEVPDFLTARGGCGPVQNGHPLCSFWQAKTTSFALPAGGF